MITIHVRHNYNETLYILRVRVSVVNENNAIFCVMFKKRRVRECACVVTRLCVCACARVREGLRASRADCETIREG